MPSTLAFPERSDHERLRLARKNAAKSVREGWALLNNWKVEAHSHDKAARSLLTALTKVEENLWNARGLLLTDGADHTLAYDLDRILSDVYEEHSIPGMKVALHTFQKLQKTQSSAEDASRYNEQAQVSRRMLMHRLEEIATALERTAS